MLVNTDEKKIEKLLSRGVEEVFIKDNLVEKLKSGRQLRIKLGIDPTGPKIHIGRAVALRKLKEFQDMGHKIVLIVGDFTAQIGDPSDKDTKRPMLSKKKIKKNLKEYKKQLGKIINLRKTEFKFNNKWLKKLNFQEISELAESFSVQQMISRRNFKERIEKEQEVSLREFLYPLMQGYDSVAVKADVEIGGSDQLFNLKAGRVIQKHYGQKEQDILTTQMLEGTDGRKMSTSWGNVINLLDEPDEMFGKIMSLKDELISKYLLLCTDVPVDEIQKVEESIKKGELNPRDAKIGLAKEIVTIYHGEKKAERAEKQFVDTFSKGNIPKDIETITAKEGMKLSNVLLGKSVIQSKSEFVRLVREGAVNDILNDEKITNFNHKITKTSVYRIGKHRFIKIEV